MVPCNVKYPVPAQDGPFWEAFDPPRRWVVAGPRGEILTAEMYHAVAASQGAAPPLSLRKVSVFGPNGELLFEEETQAYVAVRASEQLLVDEVTRRAQRGEW